MMKIGRNDLCLCGSDKKYKKCCISSIEKVQADVVDHLEQVVAMNPDLSLDELQLVADNKIAQMTTQGIDDFCGLTSDQMHNWLYAPFKEVQGVKINTPQDISSSQS